MNKRDMKKLIWLNNVRYIPFGNYEPMTRRTMKRLEYLEKHIEDDEFPTIWYLVEKTNCQQIGYDRRFFKNERK